MSATEIPFIPNGWCVILGTPGKDPLTIVGPFVAEADALAHQGKHQAENPTVPAMVDVLIDQRNC